MSELLDFLFMKLLVYSPGGILAGTGYFLLRFKKYKLIGCAILILLALVYVGMYSQGNLPFGVVVVSVVGILVAHAVEVMIKSPGDNKKRKPPAI